MFKKHGSSAFCVFVVLPIIAFMFSMSSGCAGPRSSGGAAAGAAIGGGAGVLLGKTTKAGVGGALLGAGIGAIAGYLIDEAFGPVSVRGGSCYGCGPVVGPGYGMFRGHSYVTLVVLNTSPYPLDIYLSADKWIRLDPGGRADIPITMDHDPCQKVFTATAVDGNDQMVGTAVYKARIPGYGRGSSAGGDILWEVKIKKPR